MSADCTTIHLINSQFMSYCDKETKHKNKVAFLFTFKNSSVTITAGLPFIHQFSTSYPGPVLRPLSHHLLQLFHGDIESFPSQERHINPPACSEFATGSLPGKSRNASHQMCWENHLLLLSVWRSSGSTPEPCL